MKKSKIVEPTDKNKETINPVNHAITLALLHIVLKQKNPREEPFYLVRHSSAVLVFRL